MDDDATTRGPGDFGGQCLVGACTFDADLVMPDGAYFGLPKTSSYLYGTWRDGDGNLLRALRGVETDSSVFRYLFVSEPGGQLSRHAVADEQMFTGASEISRQGESVVLSAAGDPDEAGFLYRHEPDGCAWDDGEFLSIEGRLVGPGLQWFNPWPGGGCYSASAKYRSSGTYLGRPVEGFVGHEIHYFAPDVNWMQSPYGAGRREICWQQIANEYEDGSIIQATFAYGNEGWGFAMLQDEAGEITATTDVEVSATVRPNGYPETITYRFADQSWTWRIDPQGERAKTIPGAPLGADGTCTRDGDDRGVVLSMGNSDWWTDGRADRIL